MGAQPPDDASRVEYLTRDRAAAILGGRAALDAAITKGRIVARERDGSLLVAAEVIREARLLGRPNPYRQVSR